MKKKKEKLKCGSLPTADIVGAVGKTTLMGCYTIERNLVNSILASVFGCY